MDLKKLLPGIMLSLLLGLAAILLGELIPLLGSITIGLLAGIALGNGVKIEPKYQAGLSFTANKMLEISVLFLALGINFTHIANIGAASFIYLSIVVLLILLASIYFSDKFGQERETALLTGFGTAICGSSAIAAVSPTIAKNNEQTGIALAVVNLLGLGAMLSLPLLLTFLGAGELRSGFILGGGLHSVANVAGAGFAVNDETARIAITIKLARIALLSPALILYSYLIRKDSVKNWKDHFKLPWYIWSFIGISCVVSFIEVPPQIIKTSEMIGKMVLAIALAAIGLKVSFRTLYQSGKKAILFGILIFLIQLFLLSAFSYLI